MQVSLTLAKPIIIISHILPNMPHHQNPANPPCSTLITTSIIKTGLPFFDKYLTDTVTKKNDRKRKHKQDLTSPLNNNYSPINLIKVERRTLESNQILAQEIMKASFLKDWKEEEDDGRGMGEAYRFYEDFEVYQRLAKLAIRKIVKPILKEYEQFKETAGVPILKGPLCQFQAKSELLINRQTEIQFDQMDRKFNQKPRLETKKEMIEKLDQKMLYFGSNIQIYLRTGKNDQKMNLFQSKMIRLACEQFAKQFGDKDLTYNHEQNLLNFSIKFRQTLPSYLQSLKSQDYEPLPWKTNFLQKQLSKITLSKITGKVLYRYEHNLAEVKESQLNMRLYNMEKKDFAGIKKYLAQKQKQVVYERNLNGKQRLQNHKYEISQSQKESDDFNDRAIRRRVGMARLQKTIPRDIEQVQKQATINGPLMRVHPANKIISYTNPRQSQMNNVVKSVNDVNTILSQSAKKLKNESLDLDLYKFSKHQQSVKNYHRRSFEQENGKNRLRQAMEVQNDQKKACSPRQKVDKSTKKSKLLRKPICMYGPQTFRKSSKEESVKSNDSDTLNAILDYKQKKQTKRNKSILENTPQRSNSLEPLKINQNCNQGQINKNSPIYFYPIKIGNLVLEAKHHAYLEYNSAKEDLKTFPMKFLIDRMKHGVDSVQILIPSIGHNKNSNNMKINDQQKAKQIIKIILTLGGNIDQVKSQSGYFQPNPSVFACRPKISSEIQIYKFFYKDLTYFEIIDALNLQIQWIQEYKRNTNVGWTY